LRIEQDTNICQYTIANLQDKTDSAATEQVGRIFRGSKVLASLAASGAIAHRLRAKTLFLEISHDFVATIGRLNLYSSRGFLS
jgi:hypothetical protein